MARTSDPASFRLHRIEAKTAVGERKCLLFHVYLGLHDEPAAFGTSAGWFGSECEGTPLPFVMDHKGRLNFGRFAGRQLREGRIRWKRRMALAVGATIVVRVANEDTTYTITRVSCL